MARKKLSFEEALRQLEQIAEQIEQGTIGLEESIARYEEGMGLVRHCRDILTQAELRIQKLHAQDDATESERDGGGPAPPAMQEHMQQTADEGAAEPHGSRADLLD